VSSEPARPVRMCVGCRGRAPKSSLLRIVATPEGALVDRLGALPGRGAYVHRDPWCVETSCRAGVLSRALRRRLGDDELGRLKDEIERMVIA
jgi:uncharacterized protein